MEYPHRHLERASTLATYGCPTSITLDRETRWVGSPAGSDFPAAWLRFGACQGSEMVICDPHQPQQMALSNATTAPTKKSAWPWIGLLTGSKPKPRPLPSCSTPTWSDRIKDSPVATALPAPPFHTWLTSPRCLPRWIRIAGSASSIYLCLLSRS